MLTSLSSINIMDKGEGGRKKREGDQLISRSGRGYQFIRPDILIPDILALIP